MLFRPVYCKGEKMKSEARIRMVPAKTPPREDSPPPTPPAPVEEAQPDEETEEDDAKHRIPLLVSGNNGVAAVFPKEATRDVLSGRVDYYLVDESGVTLLRKKHIFNALKLNDERIHKYEDFPCVGAHERVLENSSRKPPRKGLGYRRRFISPSLIERGIYGSSSSSASSWRASSPRSSRRMSADSLCRGFAGPRA